MSSDRIKDQDGKDKTATTNQAIKSSKASQIAIWLLLGGAIVIAALVFASWFFGGERIPDYVGYPLEGEQKEAVIEQNSPLTDYVYLTANADFPLQQSQYLQDHDPPYGRQFRTQERR